MSEYLWDKTGEPDAEVERLETLLSSFGHTPRPLALPSEAAPDVSRRRAGAWRRLVPARPWRRFLPARIFEPVGLAATAALLITFLLGAGALMRGRLFVDESRAVSHEEQAASHEVRRTQPLESSSQAPTPERRGSASAPREVASAGRGSEMTNVKAKSGGGPPFVRDAARRRAGAEAFAFVKPRQRTAATAAVEQTAARAGGTGTLETLSARGREGATSLFDGTRLMAKEQLIYALRLTGAKLKEVQTKAHGAGDSKPARGGGVR